MAVQLSEDPRLGVENAPCRRRRREAFASACRVGRKHAALRRRTSGVCLLQTDPIGLAGGINTYVYAVGNPLRFIDRDGRIIGPIVQIIKNWPKVVRTIEFLRSLLPRIVDDIPAARLPKVPKDPLEPPPAQSAPNPNHPKPVVPPNIKIPPGTIPSIVLPGSISLSDEPIGMGSPDPISDSIQREFCEQNPNAPNCRAVCPVVSPT